MGIFSKKPPCPICGGKIPLLLPLKIEGEYICNDCRNLIDMDPDREASLTMRGFREYLAFYEENRQLKDRFEISEQVDFGFWSKNFIFDYPHRLFCMSNAPDKTVFEGAQLKGFSIREDGVSLIEGSAAGVRRYESTVPSRVMAMTPRLNQIRMNKQLARNLDRMDDGKINHSAGNTPYYDIQEPFQAFHVELSFDHPYWRVMRLDIDGPRFNNEFPDANDYLRDYQDTVRRLERLADAFKTVAFPTAMEQGPGAARNPAPQEAAAPLADAAGEIRKYKALLEDGVLSQEEFDAKKRQLLGI